MVKEYESYNLEELREIRDSFHPAFEVDELKQVEAAIAARQAKHNTNHTLVDIEDTGIHLKVERLSNRQLRIKIKAGYNMLVSYQRAWLTLTLGRAEFIKFRQDLAAGNKSTYGQGDFFAANKILIQSKDDDTSSCHLVLYRRWMVIGFSVSNAQISSAILDALLEVEV